MSPINGLILQVRRKQLMLCVYEPAGCEVAAPPGVDDITELLHLSTAECLCLVDRLERKRLIELTRDAEPPGVRLTSKGRRLVQRMSRDRLAQSPPVSRA